jgi:hypothetical protein
MSELKLCPLCNSEKITQTPISGYDGYRFTCHRCKEYKITEEFLRYTGGKYLEENGFLLSGLARELYETELRVPTFTWKDKDIQLKHHLIYGINSVSDKANKLMERFRERSGYFGDSVHTKADPDYPLGYAKNQDEYLALINLLNKKGLIEIDKILKEGYIQNKLIVTEEGWNLNKNIESSDSNQVFIASWFDKSTDKTISAIIDAVNSVKLDLKPMCIKDEHFSERIMDKALGEIRKSRFAIVDLTGNRNSVFFEIGFLYGLGKQCIFVYKKDREKTNPDLEFYVKHYKCHEYENADDLKKTLVNVISARYDKK